MDTHNPEWSAQVDPRREAPSPLYLAPAGPTWVGLDGPTLRVSQPDRAERLYPLRRIGRVHCNPHVDWEQEALLACAQAGIPVLFLDDDGLIRARLLGRPGQRDELRNRLVEFLLRPEAVGMLNHWLEEHGERAARWAAIKLGNCNGHTKREPRRDQPLVATFRSWLNQRAEHLAGADAALHSRQWLRGLAYGWMEEHLADLGFARTSEVAQVGVPPLAANLTDVFYWYLEPARLGWLTRRHLAARRRGEPLRPPTYRETVRLFESHPTRAATRGREITGALHRWLIHEAG